MSSSCRTGEQHPLGEKRRDVRGSGVGLGGQVRAAPAPLHAAPCSRSHSGASPGPPAASTAGIGAAAPQAAPGSPEKRLPAGICPWGHGHTGLAREQGHTQPAARSAGSSTAGHRAPGAGTPSCHSQQAKRSFHGWFQRSSQNGLLWPRPACPVVPLGCGVRALAVQVPVPGVQLTGTFVTPIRGGTMSQRLARSPWPSWCWSLPSCAGSCREEQGSWQLLQEPGKGEGVSASVIAGLCDPLCHPCSLSQYLLPCPAPDAPQHSSAGAGTLEGRAASCRAFTSMGSCSSRTSGTKECHC